MSERIAVNVLDQSDGKVKIWEMSRKTYEELVRMATQKKPWYMRLWSWLWKSFTNVLNAARHLLIRCR